MTPVNKMKASPLPHRERPKNKMRDSAPRAENGFPFPGNGIQADQFGSYLSGKFVAASNGQHRRRTDAGRRFPSAWKVAESKDAKLPDALAQTGKGAGAVPFVDPSLDGRDTSPVGLQQVFDDLLDRPTIRMIPGSRLRLIRRETTYCGG